MKISALRETHHLSRITHHAVQSGLLMGEGAGWGTSHLSMATRDAWAVGSDVVLMPVEAPEQHRQGREFGEDCRTRVSVFEVIREPSTTSSLARQRQVSSAAAGLGEQHRVSTATSLAR